MHPGRLIYALLGAGLLVLAGVVAALVLGVGGPTLGGDAADLPGEVSLDSFTSAGGTCVPDEGVNASTELRPEGDETALAISANVTVPATNYALDPPTIERTGPTTYALNVTSREVTEKQPETCDGVAQARYTATVRVPHANRDQFTVVVRHDGEVVQEIRNGEDGSGAGSEGGGLEGSDDEAIARE